MPIPYSKQQLQVLETAFSNSNYLAPAEWDDLSQAVGLSRTQIKTWFKNKRRSVLQKRAKLARNSTCPVAHQKLSANVAPLPFSSSSRILETTLPPSSTTGVSMSRALAVNDNYTNTVVRVIPVNRSSNLDLHDITYPTDEEPRICGPEPELLSPSSIDSLETVDLSLLVDEPVEISPESIEIMKNVFVSSDISDDDNYLQEPGWVIYGKARFLKNKAAALQLTSLKNMYRFSGLNVTSSMFFKYEDATRTATLDHGLTLSERKSFASGMYERFGGLSPQEISQLLPQWTPAHLVQMCLNEPETTLAFLDNLNPILQPLGSATAPPSSRTTLNVAVPIYSAGRITSVAVLLIQGISSHEIKSNRVLRDCMDAIALSMRSQW